jgi:soluble lytic murein transglycosylase
MRRSLRWLLVGVGLVVVPVACVHAQSQKPAGTRQGKKGVSQKAEPKAKPEPRPPLPVPNPERQPPAAQAPGAPVKAENPAAPAADPGAKPAEPQTAGPSEAPATPPVPKPEPLTPEAEYLSRLDQLISPVRDFSPSAEDLQRVRDLFKSPGPDVAAARAQRAQINDTAARKLVEWNTLKSGLGEPQDYVVFLDANPDWPERTLLQRRAEEQLFTAGGSASRIAAFFKSREPRSGTGWAALASAHLAEKNEAKARELAAMVWREYELPASLETGFLERFGSLLGEADHKRRLDRILVDEVRLSAERSERAAFARRVIPLLAEPERKKAEARLAIFLRAKLAGQLLSGLPAEAEGETDWGLAYQKVQHFRRLGQHEEAWKILKAAPTDPELLVSPDDWWAERRGAAYDALKAGNAELAYELVAKTGPLSVNPRKDQTFMAGWLALRHLEKPDAALAHFEASRAAADGPLSKARADYWAGRALEALGRAGEARQRYASAAVVADTFHGLLARQKLDGAGPHDIRSGLPAIPTAAEAQRFNASDAVRGAVIASKAGLNRNVVRALFGHLRNHFESEGELAMLAHLASALGDPQTSLRVGKTAIARGMNLVNYAYPLHTFPAYTPLREPPEPAILLGIARQESEFNNSIVSSAGARGLLQVMPITAKHICRDHKIKCEIPRLVTDNAYNAMIASAYIGDRMAEFRGSYVLTLAGYNAGPGRARQWMREFGDPRDPAVDPIDWIERIPIEETREYVKKVLSNVQVYRARLGVERALRLEQDLRAHSGTRRAGATAGETK